MVDVLIIGSGPAGLGAALYAARSGVCVLIAEKEYEGTGQIAESHLVDNYLGLPGETGYDLGERFLRHVEKAGVSFYEGEAEKIYRTEDFWEVLFSDGSKKRARSLIYAAGAHPRRLNVPGEDRLTGRGVSYCALCDGALYGEKDVAVVGGGDTALDDALYLSAICRKVYLVHRRRDLRGRFQAQEQVKSRDNIELVTEVHPVKIIGEEHVEGLLLDNGRELKVSGIFCAIGSVPATDILRDFAALDAQGYVLADETGKTQTPGLFVAGDVRKKNLRQVITAVADGANAAAAAGEYLLCRTEQAEFFCKERKKKE